MTNIHTPAKIDAHRLRAPAATFSAVLLTDPPTGVPWKNPDSQVRHALADEVPVGPRRRASGFGAASATPAPWTSAIAAIAKRAADHPDVRSDRCGSTSGGNPLGIAPTSATVATLVETPSRATTTVGTTTAISDANSASRVRLSRNITASADHPDDGRRGVDVPPGWVTTYSAFCAATPPSVGDPDQPGELTEDDVDGHAGEETEHHRPGDEPDVAAEVQHPGSDHHRCRSGSSG